MYNYIDIDITYFSDYKLQFLHVLAGGATYAPEWLIYGKYADRFSINIP